MGKFCQNCGTSLTEQSLYCPVCGAKNEKQTLVPQMAARPVKSQSGGKARKKSADILLLIVAVLIFSLGAGTMALTVVGRATKAQVISYEQMLYLNNDDSTRNPGRYKLAYQFTVNDEQYTGAVTRVFAGGSHMRQTISIKYLPFWPHVNAEDSNTVALTGSVMIVAGILMALLAVKKKKGRK